MKPQDPNKFVTQSAKVGDRVLYVLPNGKVRPAVVTESFGGGLVNLIVTLDGQNDKGIKEGHVEGSSLWVESKEFSLNKEPGTWHTRQ